MARTMEELTIELGETQQITEGDATNISFQVISGEGRMFVQANGAEASAGWLYARGQGERNIPLTDLTHAPAGARVYMTAVGLVDLVVLVDHA